MMLLHAATCTVTRDDMPGGLLDMSFLAGGMDMHACTVESATTSTQHPSPTPSVPSRSLASFQVAVFALPMAHGCQLPPPRQFSGNSGYYGLLGACTESRGLYRGWYSICRVSGVRFPIFVCDWGNWPYPFAGQLGQLLPNARPASPLLVHELLSGPYGSPLYPFTSDAVAVLVAFSHSSARSLHP